MFKKLSTPLKTAAWRVLAVLLLAPAAYADPQPWQLDMPRGVTTLSDEIMGLHHLILIICTVICVGVFGFAFYTIATCRRSQGAKASQFSHSTKAEIIWTVIPTLILIFMAVPSARTILKIEDTSGADMSIKVTGYQWKWSYDYLDEDKFFYSTIDQASNAAYQQGSGIDPASVEHYLRNVDNPMVVPVNTKVRLLLTADDVIHSWWVPQLYVKKDANPGFINETWFEATQTGTFRGQCTELCGRGHGFMPIVVVVVEEAEYQQWLDGRLAWDQRSQQLVATTLEEGTTEGEQPAETLASL